MATERYARRVPEPQDQRTEAQRDRDRILYSSAFRRLGGVTQVVSAEEAELYHSRLTHSLKVAQLARRIAEDLLRRTPEPPWQASVDPDVCEAAALAHDLGHPVFGHIGEAVLDELVQQAGDRDGFEGNAQSFRIVTRLAQRRAEFPGLNLARATLDAILKYPRFRGSPTGTPEYAKFGAYASEGEFFRWARELHEGGDTEPSLEAQIMDFADDVTYAVHDIEDFYRAGLIPLDRLANETYRQQIFSSMTRRWRSLGSKSPLPEDQWTEAETALHELWTEGPLDFVVEPYAGTKKQRQVLRATTARLINRYRKGVSVEVVGSRNRLRRGYKEDIEISLLKQLVWEFVIAGPSLRTQQLGQERVVRELFQIFIGAIQRKDLDALPVPAREQLEEGVPAPRVVADAISGYGEAQAVKMWRRLTGQAFGTVTDRLGP